MKTNGKTPWQTMRAQLFVDVPDNEDSRFLKVCKRPTRLFLKSRRSELSEAGLKKIEIEEERRRGPRATHHLFGAHAQERRPRVYGLAYFYSATSSFEPV